MSTITVLYNNAQITTINSSGTKVLKTKDKVCNDNIKINYVVNNIPLDLDATRVYAYIKKDTGEWKSASDSYSIVVPVIVGRTYGLYIDPATQVAGYDNYIYRFGFSDTNIYPSQLTNYVITTPQESSYTEIVATKQFLIIQCAAGVFEYLINNDMFTITLLDEKGTGIIEYNENIIATISDTETIKFKTKNKFCNSNISITYTI